MKKLESLTNDQLERLKIDLKRLEQLLATDLLKPIDQQYPLRIKIYQSSIAIMKNQIRTGLA